MPAAPTIAAMTTSTFGSEATVEAPSGRMSTDVLTRERSRSTSAGSRTETTSGRYRSTCSASRSILPPAASPTTRTWSEKASTTASVLRPMEPVLPRMETVRMSSGGHDPQTAEAILYQHPVHVQDRCSVEDRVETVEEASVAGDQRARILDRRRALPHRLGQIADDPGDREQAAGDDGMDERHFLEKCEMNDHRSEHRHGDAADESLDRLLRTDPRRELAAAETFADVVRTG